MYFRAVSLRTIRARALGGAVDKRPAAYPKLRRPSSYLLSLVLEKEEGGRIRRRWSLAI